MERTGYEKNTACSSWRSLYSAARLHIATASAARVEWIDTDKNRGDRIILFTDGKGDQYISYFGADDFTIEKQ